MDERAEGVIQAILENNYKDKYGIFLDRTYVGDGNSAAVILHGSAGDILRDLFVLVSHIQQTLEVNPDVLTTIVAGWLNSQRDEQPMKYRVNTVEELLTVMMPKTQAKETMDKFIDIIASALESINEDEEEDKE